MTTDAPAYPTIGQLLVEQGRTRPDAVAVIFPDSQLRYGELLENARLRASALAAAGVGPGDRIGLAMDDGPEMLQLMLGASLLGATAALFVDHLGDTLASRVRMLNIGLIIVGGRRGEVVRATLDQIDDINLIDEKDQQYAIFLSEGQHYALPDRDIAPGAAAYIIYTAGVTAPAKQIHVTHQSLTCKAAPMKERFELDQESRMWIGVGMCQIGFVAPFVAALACGATVVLTPGRDTDANRALISEHKVTHAYPIYLGNWLPILSSPNFMASLFSALSHVCLIGPVSALRRAQRVLPQAVILTTYGSAEEGGAFCLSRPTEPADRRLTTCGRPFPGHEVRIFGTVTQNVLGFEKIGEIQVRGPGLPPPGPAGQYSSSYTDDGWLMTSDLGLLTADGAVVYRGRGSEILQIGGEAVFALDIETVIAQHRDVAVAQVVAQPDEVLGEVAAVFIELRPGATATRADLIQFASEHLPAELAPRTIHFVSEWPTASSKILKSVLSEWLVRSA